MSWQPAWIPFVNELIYPPSDICADVRSSPPNDSVVVLLSSNGSLYAFYDVYDDDYLPAGQPGRRFVRLEPPQRTILHRIAWSPNSNPYDSKRPTINLWGIESEGQYIWYGEFTLPADRSNLSIHTAWRPVKADQIGGGLNDITADEEGALVVSKKGGFWRCRVPQFDLVDLTSWIPLITVSAGVDTVWATTPLDQIWEWRLTEDGSRGWYPVPQSENIRVENLSVRGSNPPEMFINLGGKIMRTLNAHEDGRGFPSGGDGDDDGAIIIASTVERSWYVSTSRILYRWRGAYYPSYEYVPVEGIEYRSEDGGIFMTLVITRTPQRIGSVLKHLRADVTVGYQGAAINGWPKIYWGVLDDPVEGFYSHEFNLNSHADDGQGNHRYTGWVNIDRSLGCRCFFGVDDLPPPNLYFNLPL